MTLGMEASVAPAVPALADPQPRLRVVHLTTSYPRHEGDFAGRFVADLVRGLAGHVDVSVLAPGGYRDFGLAYGRGLVGNLRRRPWLAPLVAATRGMNLVVAGDGPLRHLVPDALGFVPHDDLGDLYGRAAVVVCPSYREGLPLCVLEAMAHGRPVVASAVGGIPELVEDGVTGFLVEPGDVAGLRAALERLLADPALRRRMGRVARKRVYERCSWDRVTAATLESYGVPAGRAQTTIPSLQYGASRPAVPRVARARLAAWPTTNGRSPSPRPTRRRGLR